MRLLRWLINTMKWATKLLMLLLVVALTGLAILLGSAEGLSWLVRTANEQIPGELRVAEVQGGLFGDLRLEGFHYSDESMRLEADSLVLRWEPRELLRPQLHVLELTVSGGRFEQLLPSEPPPESDEPLSLPDVELPLAVLLDRVLVDGFTLISAPGAEPLRLERLLLQAAAEGTRIELQTLEAVLPELAELRADGSVEAAGEWPLRLNNDLRLSLPDLPGFTLAGELSGDLKLLRLQQNLSGGAEAQIRAEVAQPLGELSWNSGLTITKLSGELAELAGMELPEGLRAELEGNGDLKQAQGALKLRLGRVVADAPAETAGDSSNSGQRQVDLTGSVEFESLQFQARGEWQSLQWPLVGDAQVVSESGELQAEGGLEAYQFKLQTRIAGPQIPPGAWSAHGTGSSERAQLEELRGEILGGQLQARADVAWAPRLEWQATLSGDGIDPGHLAPEWPGALELAISSSGSIEGEKQRIGVVIEKLAGRLRDLPLAGSGSFQMDEAGMAFREIALSSGRASLKADGRLEKEWDLDWSLDVADLADLLPEAQGAVQAEGRLTGNAERPSVRAKLAADGVQFQDVQLQHLEGDIDLQLDEGAAQGQVAAVKLRATRMGAAENLLETLELDIGGPLSAQTIRLAADHPLGALALDAKGALELETTSWQGTVGRLDLDAREWGKWALKSPVELAASPEAVKASGLCLQEGGTALCSDIDWTPTAGSAKATLQGLSFDRFKGLLPPELTALEGGVNAHLDADLGDPIRAELKLELEPGRIDYLVDATRQVRLSYQGGSLNADYGPKTLAADLNLKMEESVIAGRLQIPRAALDRDPLTAPLGGSIDLDFKQLGLLSALVPVIEKSEGLIHGKLKLGGKLGAPQAGGDLLLEMTELVVPTAGLDLSDLKIKVSGKGTQLRVDGGVSSGPGQLQLQGEVDLDGAKGWPATLTLGGERFQAVALPEARVLISPDIRVEHGRQGLKVHGTITIPESDIQLHEIPSGSRSVSSDLVIVEEDSEEAQPGLPIDARVTVILGDRVRFSGFGLRADLGGKITVTQEPGLQPVGNGELGIVKGSYRSFGQQLEIDRGMVFYAGGSLTNPGLNIRASREVNDLTVGVLVTGTAENPQIKAFSSDPTMKESDARSLLLTGTTGSSGDAAKVYAGTNVTEKLSVGTNVSVDGGETEFVARYKINRRVSVKTSSSASTSGAQVLYTFEFK